MEKIKRLTIKELLRSAESMVNTRVDVKGWVRSRRGNKYVQFVALNDGSTIKNLQIVFDLAKFSEDDLKAVTTGSSIHVQGMLVASQGKGQTVEVQAEEFELYGTAPVESYPLQKKGHTLEFLREKAHLRPRTNTFGAVLRIRHALAYAIHKFFNDKGFYYFHTPLITASDCEGAGAQFQVTTLPLNELPRTEDGKIDYSQDFFGKMANLTVSGQLEGELGATALGLIYTFGPTFRAENSNTPRHLSEFWMIEPEMAFYEIEDNMDLAEEFIKYCRDNRLSEYKRHNREMRKCIDEYNHELRKSYGRAWYAYQNYLDRLRQTVATELFKCWCTFTNEASRQYIGIKHKDIPARVCFIRMLLTFCEDFDKNMDKMIAERLDTPCHRKQDPYVFLISVLCMDIVETLGQKMQITDNMTLCVKILANRCHHVVDAIMAEEDVAEGSKS